MRACLEKDARTRVADIAAVTFVLDHVTHPATDPDQLEVTGSPVPVLDGVVMTPEGGADVAIAANGSLAYVAGIAGQIGDQTVLSGDRQGRASPLPGIPLDSYRDVDVSPDGSQVALATQADVWTYDFAGAVLTRLTTNPGPDTRPIWTSD